MDHRALELLERLTSRPERRETEFFLRPPSGPDGDKWFIFVPRWFNDALSIRLSTRIIKGTPTTAWTQGSDFSFQPGDVLYDTPEAYRDWTVAMKHIGVALQITRATSAAGAQSLVPRVPGTVRFNLLIPSDDSKSLVQAGSYSVTQDEFVRILITGGDLPRRTNHHERDNPGEE